MARKAAESSVPAEPKKKTAKTAAVKAQETKCEPTAAVTFEFADKKIVAKELLAKAKESFTAAHQDVEIKDFQLYVNANDACAYLVVNGVEYPEDKIVL